MKDEINVFLASSNDEGCKQILNILSEQKDLHIAGVEKDGSGTIIKSERLKPDVLVLDLKPSEISGEKLAPIIHRRSPQTAIVMLSDRDEENYAKLALKSGIAGFLLRDRDTNILGPVIKIVSYGGFYISASIVVKVFSGYMGLQPNNFSGKITGNFPGSIPCGLSANLNNENNLLTEPEQKIIKLIAQGYSDDEIAKTMDFCTGTVRNYVNAVKRKTRLKNRVQIVVQSLASGLIRFDQLASVPALGSR